jgi:hydroxymethylbilane synthase
MLQNEAPKKIRLGTRGSDLALQQAKIVSNLLREAYPFITTEIIPITTTGDKISDRNLADIGGKGLFIKEIEEYLCAGKIDIAVHSLKDMPAIMSEEFALPCVLQREDARDAFISYKYTLEQLPNGAVIGTSSARRAAQMLKMRPDINIVPLRGNVNTRLEKLKKNTIDATFLAMSGLKRIGLFDSKIMQPLPPEIMLPAVSQGAIAIEILSDNHKMREMLAPLNHKPSFITTNIERQFMRVFEGSCTTPIAAYATITKNIIEFKCLIAKTDGSIIHHDSASCVINENYDIGAKCAYNLKKLAGDNFFVT